jgi:CheY-like chemotaxis protein
MERAHSEIPMPCVLIVEDDDDVREFMQLLVSTSGYETMTARDGQEALVKMRQRKPCLVLLDLQMPRMDGWEFRKRQLQDVALKQIPVVCVTAFFDLRHPAELFVAAFRLKAEATGCCRGLVASA